MNAFVNAAVQTPDALTLKGAPTFHSSLDTFVDLFFLAGASRRDPQPALRLFENAYIEDVGLAVRLALWTRDARGGAGERNLFREMLHRMSPAVQTALIPKVVELGRWDDLGVLVLKSQGDVAQAAADAWKQAVLSGDGLAAKWAPRKGELAVKLRQLWDMSPKQYRKTVVTATDVVEQKMCAKRWDEIVFDHVPSVAASRYNAAFMRNANAKYLAYKEKLVKGEAKINASAVFPHDVVRAANSSSTQKDVINAQWKALPDYTGGRASDILVMSDVSGSMTSRVSGMVTAMDVSVALGLYISERQTGPFKDLVLTFSSVPTFHKVHGAGIVQRIQNLSNAQWSMSTDLNAAFRLILKTAQEGKVAAEDMPKMLVIISDMEFDSAGGGRTNFQEAEKLFAKAGYELPRIVFWNVMGRQGNSPVRKDTKNVALVSGFSPAVLTSILSAQNFSPRDVMLEAVMNERYSVPGITG